MIALLLAAAASLPIQSWEGSEGAGAFTIEKPWRAGEFEVQLASANYGGSGSTCFFLGGCPIRSMSRACGSRRAS